VTGDAVLPDGHGGNGCTWPGAKEAGGGAGWLDLSHSSPGPSGRALSDQIRPNPTKSDCKTVLAESRMRDSALQRPPRLRQGYGATSPVKVGQIRRR